MLVLFSLELTNSFNFPMLMYENNIIFSINEIEDIWTYINVEYIYRMNTKSRIFTGGGSHA